MRKLLTIFCVVGLIFALVGCSSRNMDNNGGVSPDPTHDATIVPTSSPSPSGGMLDKLGDAADDVMDAAENGVNDIGNGVRDAVDDTNGNDNVNK